MKKIYSVVCAVISVASASLIFSCIQHPVKPSVDAAGSNTNAPFLPDFSKKKSRFSVQERVNLSDLIVIAEIADMYGSRIKAVELKNLEVLRGKLPVRRELKVAMRDHPLTVKQPWSRFIFFLTKPSEIKNDTEFRRLVGTDSDPWDPGGLELATDSNIEMVREAMRGL